MLRKATFEPLRKALVKQVHQLEAKAAVPDVAREMEVILEVQTGDWWTGATPDMIEEVRRRLRALMSRIEPDKQVVINTNLADVMSDKREIDLVDLGGASSLAQFRRKARAYVDAHADHVTIARLRQGRPLTPSDLDELQKLFVDAGIAEGDDFLRVRQMPDLPDFIRSLVGLDRRAAHGALNAALAGVTLSARQIEFVERILDYLTASGRMDPALLYEPPFTDAAPNGISDVFEGDVVSSIIDTLTGFEPRLAVAL